MSETAVDVEDRNGPPFDCPRCGAVTDAEFYGPCSTCLEQLRATMRNEPGESQAVEYEPKMNVTPNHVATKE